MKDPATLSAHSLSPRPNLRDTPLSEELVASISRLLDSGGVSSVFWGNYLLTIYGIPSITNDASFAVSDEMIPRAQKLLSNAGFDVCEDPECIAIRASIRPPPVKHFHLNTRDEHICIYPVSQVLPNVSNILNEEDKIISASDPSLPKARRGFGKGAFSPEYSCVRVPSTACFLEACLTNFARLARSQEYSRPFYSKPCHDAYYLSWVAYMIDYVYESGHLQLSSLQPPFREFVVNAFLGTSAASFVAARKKLIASEL